MLRKCYFLTIDDFNRIGSYILHLKIIFRGFIWWFRMTFAYEFFLNVTLRYKFCQCSGFRICHPIYDKEWITELIIIRNWQNHDRKIHYEIKKFIFQIKLIVGFQNTIFTSIDLDFVQKWRIIRVNIFEFSSWINTDVWYLHVNFIIIAANF